VNDWAGFGVVVEAVKTAIATRAAA